jgi:cephalosporin-C deacetylase-like acetyl esterase
LELYGSTDFIPPEAAADRFIRFEAFLNDTEGEPIFRWTTLQRAFGNSLLNYSGDTSMGPPDDFDEFWGRAKEELAAVPMNPRVRELPSGHTETGLLYEVELDSVRGVTIVCRYTVPRKARGEEGGVTGRFPAMIVMPGYGSEQPPMDRTPSGFITMSVNPRHHGPSKRFWTSPVAHHLYMLDVAEDYYYRLAYLDCLRAAEFLFSLPEVDPTRVGAEGGSQGGLFAIALGALEPRISAVVSNVTAFSAFRESAILEATGAIGGIAERIRPGAENAGAVTRTIRYIDGANMATRLRAPLQINMGGQDRVCHFLSGIVILHRLRADVPREYHLFPNAKHEVPAGMRQNNAEWMRKWLRLDGAPSFPGRILTATEPAG